MLVFSPTGPDFPPVLFPPDFEGWCAASGLDETSFARVLEKVDFCLFCGDPADPWEFRCAKCRRICLDPDCHRSAPTRRKGVCGERSSSVPEGYRLGHLQAPAPDCHEVSFCAPSRFEFYCPCCLSKCNCRDPFRARSNFNLANLTRSDLTRYGWSRRPSDQRPNVFGDGLSCFVYRYRSQERTEFGHTYSPVLRTDQRRDTRDTPVRPELEQQFKKRLPGLDWLSTPFRSRHTAYLLESIVKRLQEVSLRVPEVRPKPKAAKLHKEILAKNGLFDFKLSKNPSLEWEVRGTGGRARVKYSLAVRPRYAPLGAVWSTLYRDSSPAEGGLGNDSWGRQLRLQLRAPGAGPAAHAAQDRTSSENIPVKVKVREEMLIDDDDALSYMAFEGLDLEFSLPARRLFGGFDATLVRTARNGEPQPLAVLDFVPEELEAVSKLASFRSPEVRLRVKTVRPATQSPEAVTSVRWSAVQLPDNLQQELVPEYRVGPGPASPDPGFLKSNIGCESDWGPEPCCELPWRWTASDFDRNTSSSDGEAYLWVRFVPRKPEGC